MNYIGGFFGGDRINSRPTLKVRFGDRFNSEFSYNYNNVNLPQGDFKTYLSRARLTYAFSPKIYLDGFLTLDMPVSKTDFIKHQILC